MNMPDKFEIPVPGKPRNIKLPGHYEYEFNSGIKLFVLEDNRFPLVTARFIFKSGSSKDNLCCQGKDGLSSLTSELLLKGTRSLNSKEIAEKTEYYGSVITSGSDYDASYLTFHTLEKYFEEIYGITVELILDSVFPENEIMNLKGIKINSLITSYDSGEYLAHKVFNRKLGKESGYSHKPEGCIKTLESITRDDILGFCNDNVTPENMMIAFVGNINPERAVKMVEKGFSKWKSRGLKEISVKELENPGKTEVYIINRPGAVQSDICIGNAGIRRNSPDFVPAVLLNTIFGGYFTSRINRNLREINGYTYGARSFFDWKKFSGEFLAETSVNTGYTLLSVKEIIKEMELMTKTFISLEELSNAKNYIIGNYPLQLETSNAIATKILNIELYEIEKDFYENYLSNIYDITPAQITETAAKYFKTENLVISISGDAEKIKRNFEEEFIVKQINDVDLVN